MTSVSACNSTNPVCTVSLAYAASGSNVVQDVYLQYAVNASAKQVQDAEQSTEPFTAILSGAFLHYPLQIPSSPSSPPPALNYQLYYTLGTTLYQAVSTALPGAVISNDPAYQVYTLSSAKTNEVIIGMSPLYQDTGFAKFFVYVLTGYYTANSSSCSLVSGVSRLILLELTQTAANPTPALDYTFTVTETFVCYVDSMDFPSSALNPNNIQFPVPIVGAGPQDSPGVGQFTSVGIAILAIPTTSTGVASSTSSLTQIFMAIVNSSPALQANNYCNTFTQDILSESWFLPNSYIYGMYTDDTLLTEVAIFFYTPTATASSVALVSSQAPLTKGTTTFINANTSGFDLSVYAQADTTNNVYNLPLSPAYIGFAIGTDFCYGTCISNNCPTSVETFCRGQKLFTNYCESYCFTGDSFSYDCLQSMLNVCGSNNQLGITPGDFSICNCFRSSSFYESYFLENNFANLDKINPTGQTLKALKASVSDMTQLPWCTYTPCAVGNIYPRDINTDNCPATVVCLANTDIDISGHASLNTNNLNVTQQQNCTADASYNNLVNELNGSPAAGSGTIVWKWWYTVILIVVIVVFVGVLIYGVAVAGKNKKSSIEEQLRQFEKEENISKPSPSTTPLPKAKQPPPTSATTTRTTTTKQSR